jgi:hypothetical protein
LPTANLGSDPRVTFAVRAAFARSTGNSTLQLYGVAGCSVPEAELADHERLDHLREVASRAYLHAEDKVVARTYRVPGARDAGANIPGALNRSIEEHLGGLAQNQHAAVQRLEAAADLAEALRISLPESAWTHRTSLPPHSGEVRVVQTAAAHQRLKAVHALIARGSAIGVVEVLALDVPWATASSLGPIARAGGSNDLCPFARAPISAAGRARILRLVEERKARLVHKQLGHLDPQPGSPLGWSRLKTSVSSSYVANLAFPWERETPSAAPDVRVSTDELSVDVAAVPLESQSELLMLIKVHEVAQQPLSTLRSQSYDGNTSIPIAVPAWVERQAEEAVVLGLGESLALIAPSTDPDRARMVLITPKVTAAVAGVKSHLAGR